MLEKTPSMDLHKVAEVLMGRSELKSDMEASALLNEKASTQKLKCNCQQIWESYLQKNN